MQVVLPHTFWGAEFGGVRIRDPSSAWPTWVPLATSCTQDLCTGVMGRGLFCECERATTSSALKRYSLNRPPGTST